MCAIIVGPAALAGLSLKERLIFEILLQASKAFEDVLIAVVTTCMVLNRSIVKPG